VNVGATLLFSCGARIAALPVAQVQETMRRLPVEALPGSNPCVEGVAVVRGEAVPVVDAGALLRGGAPTDAAARPGRFIRIRAGERSAVLAVDDVIGVWPEGALDLAQLPPLFDGAADDAVAALGRLDDRLLVVLRAASLVPESAWRQLAAQEDRQT